MWKMLNKILIIISLVLITGVQLGIQALEISDLKPQCCCETQCKCKHIPETAPILRNVRCGDNSDAQIIGHCLDILDTIKPIRSLKEAPQNIIQLSLNLKNMQNNIEPPPPKTILS